MASCDWSTLEKLQRLDAVDVKPGLLPSINNVDGGSGQRESKPYSCQLCPKKFANNSYLSQHLRIHMGKKPFGPCQYCGRMFTQLSHLNQHIRTHTGEKPYRCKHCEKSFSQLSNLQSHSRCHNTAMPFKCNACYKAFNSEQDLLEHIPKHKESKHLKIHICNFCGKSYTQSLYLEKHMAKHADRRDQRKMSNYTDYSTSESFDNSLNQLNSLSQLNGLDQNGSGAALRNFQQQMAAAASNTLNSNGSPSNIPPVAASGYPITTNSNHSALANSTLSSFELFQRSFQRENMPNSLRNGNERTVGFNMITPLENIKHFNQNNTATAATFNNCT